MKKRASISISPIKFSSTKKIFKSFKENEIEELPHIEELSIDTNNVNQIPNEKTFDNNMISTSTITMKNKILYNKEIKQKIQKIIMK